MPKVRERGGRIEKEKRRESRGEKEASVLGFSLAKRPRGSGTTGKEDEEERVGESGTVERPAAASS